MGYIYLVHQVEEVDISHEEDTVIRAFANFKDACSCVNELKKRHIKRTDHMFESIDFYVSQIKLEES